MWKKKTGKEKRQVRKKKGRKEGWTDGKKKEGIDGGNDKKIRSESSIRWKEGRRKGRFLLEGKNGERHD